MKHIRRDDDNQATSEERDCDRLAPILHAKVESLCDQLAGYRKNPAVKAGGLYQACYELVKTPANLVVDGFLKVQELAAIDEISTDCLEKPLANLSQAILSGRSEIGLPYQKPLSLSGKGV